jgi:hypothetical protein
MDTLPEVLEEICIGDYFRVSANTGQSLPTEHRLFIHELDFRYWTEGGGGMRTAMRPVKTELEMDFEESKVGQDKGEFEIPAHTIATMSIASSSDLPFNIS